MKNINFPLISTFVGDEVGNALGISTCEFDKCLLKHFSKLYFAEEFTFTYSDSFNKFTLTPCLYFNALVRGKKVARIIVVPQVRYLNLDESIELINEIVNLIDRANWREVVGNYMPPQLLKPFFSKYTNSKTDIKSWETNNELLILTIERIWSDGEIFSLIYKSNSLFLLKLGIYQK
jgi:hypothetical protein